MRIRFFETAAGSSPVRRYLDRLDKVSLSKVDATLADLRVHGMSGDTAWIKKIRERIWELKSGPHRILFSLIGADVAVLLHAFTKQGRRLPATELKTAQSRLSRLTR